MSLPKPLTRRPPSVAVALLLVFAAAPLRGEPPAAWRDDADLHAVHFVGKAIGWAVGDHGTALRTIDGGRTWEPRPVPADVSLRAVYFLTDEVGWAAGGTTVPFTGVEAGAVFATEDAGVSWKRVDAGPVPRLHAVRFFSRTEGIAAGAASPDCPSGVLTTDDGGATWTPLQTATVLNLAATPTRNSPGRPSPRGETAALVNPAGWRAGAFVARDRGVVVGPRGRRAGVGEGRLIASRETTPGLRGLNAVALVDGLNGWAAGDGGLLLKTNDAGLIWEEPPAVLRQDARDLFDLQAVAAVGTNVWAAGRPGSLVWRSPDGGRSWLAQATGTSLPIRALHFASETDGVAVGAMGLVLRTTDGGTTWHPVRAADRRAALLTIATRPEGVSFPLVATLAGDQGYRAVALLPVRHDLGAADAETPNLDLRMHDAVVSAGGNAAVTDWPLPLSTPGIEHEQDALVAEWNRRTEGKLERVLVGRIVAAVRTWRPEVVVLEEPAPGDAAADLVFQAARTAAARAADPTLYGEHQPALPPWRVKKVYVRLRSGETADAAIDRDGVLSRLGLAAADLADDAAARVGVFETSSAARETYRLLVEENEPRPAGPFFGGLTLVPGSPARRAVGEPAEDPRAALLASRQRNFRAYAEKAFDDPRQAAGAIAQIDELSAGLTPSQAARQLYLMAETYRRDSRWDLAEQAYLALIERYPSEPPGRDAMTWLLRLWTGAEPVWRRMRDKGTTTTHVAGSLETLPARIDAALRMAEQGTPAATGEQIAEAGLAADPLRVVTAAGALKVDGFERWDDATVAHWRQQALRLGSLIRRNDPALFSTPEVQFPLAVAVRTGGGAANAYMQRFAAEGKGGSWQSAAAAELTLARPGGSSQVTTALCGRAAAPPHLDAVFSDPCWQAAKALDLATDPSAPLPDGGLLLLARDDTFLYLAASLPRVPGRPAPAIELAGRAHDADLAPHDRIVVAFDVDRDYATSFRFAVDHRGQTAEDCWGDAAWNPKWFVHTDGDESRWRVEAAIPFSELGPRPPAAGEVWAISVARIVPAAGVQGWPRPNEAEPRPESFGLMRFE